ncbi:lysophospholipid acyltransferase family protein [Yoonia sp. 208BN28-4]|uniref:lysophospholipid acyltransferase family protein n=1 Tax=Yoonia sp. 208BN28-4 TaxID=3126505 RepID=UPI0030B63294
MRKSRPDKAQQHAPIPQGRYDRRALSYANTFADPIKRGVIHTMEMMTGKVTVGRWVKEFEAMGPAHGQEFYNRVFKVMGIDLATPDSELAKIPKTGPVIVVANHPHGLVDGIALANIIGKVRPDYRILTRSVLTNFDEEATQFLIPVPFPHDPDAQTKMVEMRRQAMAYLKQGGVVALFPSGVVATSSTMFGPVEEAEWNVFTAKLIRTSGAVVVPLKFEGRNSRSYQIANRLSPTLRQGLLVHEVVRAKNRPIAPVVGDPIDPAEIDARISNARSFMGWLRDLTLSLRRD